ncbi:N-acyl homoserine lactonase family protein [Listeria seeligeri]|uniref:N-acyl homoserine lactonase family protein n=1 Tax=Listeria seeligeri TaxID=1640 RepID=UPI0016297BC7|nr:N-acyl homoserine lactonase family protein [Listeria seeligeri]MBC1471942.1 N-acyl homoserine lactonase family protein [Listeria seeligeri]
MDKNIKIHILHTGTVIVDEALPFSNVSNRPLAWTGVLRSKKHLISLPVSVYLIEHPKGLILIDTGWHTDNRTKQISNLSFQYQVNKAELPVGQAIHEQLNELGYRIEDIDYVLMSHMHCDHADGLRHVKNAKRILLSKPEYQAIKKDKMHYLPHEWKGVNLDTFELSKTGLGPKGYSFDLFGDGTIQMIWCPGHSKGLCTTLIKNEKADDFVMLASDVGYANKSWKENILPGVLVDKKEAQNSLNWVKKVSKDEHCIYIVANHDPYTKPQTIII